MTEYLKRLLPRLQQFSSRLDKKEVFIDKQWIYFDDDNNQHTYIFKRDGRLIMSLNGNTQTGKWELLPEAHSLHIDRNKDQILLNQELIFDGLMLLRKDGSSTPPWVLINKEIIPDLNYVNYLKNLIVEKMRLQVVKLNDGKAYYFSENYNYGSGLNKGSIIYDEDFNQLTGNIKIGCGSNTLIIQNGLIINIIYQKEYKTLKGNITIYQHNLYEIYLNDEVFQNNLMADGYYEFKDKNVKSIDTKNGKIISIKLKRDSKIIALVISLIMFLSVVIIFANIVDNKEKKNDSAANTTPATISPDTMTAAPIPAAVSPDTMTAAPIPTASPDTMTASSIETTSENENVQWIRKQIGNNIYVRFPSEPEYNTVYGMPSYLAKTDNCVFISLVQDNALPNDTYWQLARYSANEQEPVISSFLDNYVESKLSTARASLITSQHIKIGSFLGREIIYSAINPATGQKALRFARIYFITNTVYNFECWFLNNSSDSYSEKDTYFNSIIYKP